MSKTKVDKNNKRFIILAVVVVVLFWLFVLAAYIGHLMEEKNEKDAKMSEISYKVPSKFEKDYGYSYYDDSVSCYFYVDAYKKGEYYKSSKEFLEKSVYFAIGDEIGDITEEVINGIKMNYIYKKYEYNTEYYYSFESTHYLYLLKYKITDYDNGDRPNAEDHYCYKAQDKIMSSVKVK